MNIKERREKMGITQKELAEKAGISTTFMCDIEQGRNNPSIDVAIRLAKALKVKDINIFK